MRNAYIGLSSPLFYDYGNPASKTKSDKSSSPNPILESPTGLMLFFDNLYFLTRSLCPENMRNVKFVHFLDEENLLPDLSKIDFSKLIYAQVENLHYQSTTKDRNRGMNDFFKNYDNIRKTMKIDWEGAKHDNHSHQLEIKGTTFTGNSQSFGNLVIDMELSRLAGLNLELITNSYVQSYLDCELNTLVPSKLTEALVIERIPNFIDVSGPYHEIIEEVRLNSYLTAFRKWVNEKSKNVSLNEITEVKQSIENELENSVKKLFLKHIEEKRIYKSVGKTVTDAIGDAFCPGFGTVRGICESFADWIEIRDYQWQAFLVSID